MKDNKLLILFCCYPFAALMIMSAFSLLSVELISFITYQVAFSNYSYF
jgi:hypothetical protein